MIRKLLAISLVVLASNAFVSTTTSWAAGPDLLFARTGELIEGNDVTYVFCLSGLSDFSSIIFQVEANEGLELGDFALGSWFAGQERATSAAVGDDTAQQVLACLDPGADVSASAIQVCCLRAAVVGESATGISVDSAVLCDAAGHEVALQSISEVDSLPPAARAPRLPRFPGPRSDSPSISLTSPSPNPGTSGSTVSFSLPHEQHVQLCIFDIHGRLVTELANGVFPAGLHSAHWNGRSATDTQAAPGIYFFSLRAGHTHLVRKTTLLR